MLSHITGIVAGGASGLGAATTSLLTRQGAKVVVADLPARKDDFLRLAETHNNSNNSNLLFVEADVRDTTQITQALDNAEQEFGEPINTAINCAGVAPAQKTLSQKKGTTNELQLHSLDTFSNTLDVNVVGTFNVARLAAERMMRREPAQDGLRGCIINTASIAAYEGQIGQVAYATSKGAIVSMTLPMARDLSKEGIRVMTIAPGLFQTPLLDGLPQKVKDELGATVPCPSRLGNPEEYAQLVVSILTNPMLNGSVIRLDGALRMPPK